MARIKLNLIQKIIIVFAIVLIPFFLLIGFAADRIFKQQVIENANQSIGTFTMDEGEEMETYFERIEQLGLRSVEYIKKQLSRNPTMLELEEFDTKYQLINGALRTNLEAYPDEDISGVFLSNISNLDDEIKKIIISTEGVFETYAQGIQGFVFNMYIITKHQLIRIYKKDWALEIDPDHDFTKDEFYTAADPSHSPDRKARWTSTYYDSIWKHWMTSLITPIYINDEFLGIIGHDVILDDVYDNILKKKFYNTGYSFIFDGQGNIVIHPHYLNRLQKIAKMGQTIASSPDENKAVGDEPLRNAIFAVLNETKAGQKLVTNKLVRNSEMSHFNVYKLDFLDWHYATVIPNDEVMKMLPQLRMKLIGGSVLAGLVLFLIITILVWYYMVSPITRVSKATKEIGEGNLDYRISFNSGDEIGALVSSFNNMTGNLKEITASRDLLNKEIAERKHAESELKKHHEHLEELVLERTNDLQKSNKDLQLEIKVRISAENEMSRLRNLLSNIINSMPSIMVGVDPDGCVTQWNLQAEKFTGIKAPQAHGLSLSDVFPQLNNEMERIQKAIKEKKPLKNEKVMYEKDGEQNFSDITVYPLITNGVEGAVIRMDDVTDRIRIEEMMIQSEKMLSVGGLAAGMAHEINNPLASIIQNMQVIHNRIASDLPQNHKAAEECGVMMKAIQDYMEKRDVMAMIAAVKDSGERAAKIVNNMLSFSRKSQSQFSTHDLGKLMDQTVDLASNDYDLKKKYDFRQIEIVRNYDPEMSLINCEGNQIQQVMLNILKNGAQIMFDNRQKNNDPKFILSIKKEENYAIIEIEDNSIGMDEKTRKRIFEPFFTTKAVGEGVGLGLSVSYFIITENHHGSMTVESVPGKGSKFIIQLPFDLSNL